MHILGMLRSVRSRRFGIAGLMLASLLTWAGTSQAQVTGEITYDNQGQAYAACQSAKAAAAAKGYTEAYLTSDGKCNIQGSPANGQLYRCRVGISSGFRCDNAYPEVFRWKTACSGLQSSTTQFLPVSGSKGCNLGCEVVYAQNADETSTRSTTGATCNERDYKNNCPTGSYWNGYMGVCEPVDKPCPADQKKVNGQCVPDGKCPEGMIGVPGTTPGAIQQGSLYCKPVENECPAGNVKSSSGQCLPGDGQCAAGEAKGKDGTCKRDANNDGKPDEEEGPEDPNKESASGGDSCNAPPSCSGGAISCMQVKIQWRIDCNTRKNRNISGGTCSSVPICTGDKCDAMEYASLLQQWKAACALEKMAGQKPGESSDSTDANGNGVPDALEGTGTVAEPGDGQSDVNGAKRFGIGVSTSLLDQENIFGGGSCPEPPSFELAGATISGSDFPWWCKAMSILRALILLFGAFTALKILMGWGF